MKLIEKQPRTPTNTKKQKNISRRLREEALRWLVNQFPEAFDTSERIRPLKKGIMADILLYAPLAEKSGISKSKLREAVVIFTRRIDYLACLKNNQQRIDLEGNPADEVTAEEAARAALKLKKRVENTTKKSFKPIAEHSKIEEKHEEVKKPAAIIIKSKRTLPRDPDLVSRLKEKLGLIEKNTLA